MKSKYLLPILMVLFLIILFVDYECPFKFFGMPCPGCGMTRSLESLFELNIVESFRFNILGIPIFILMIISGIILIKDVITKKDTFYELFIKYTQKYIWILIAIFILAIIVKVIYH